MKQFHTPVASAAPRYLSRKSPTESRRRLEAQEHATAACANAMRWVENVCRLTPLGAETNADDAGMIVREAEAVLGMRLDLICTVYRCKNVVDDTCKRFVEKATLRADQILTQRLEAAAYDETEDDWLTLEVAF